MAEQFQHDLDAGAKVRTRKPVDPRRTKRRRWIILFSILGLLVAGEIGFRIFADKDSRFNIRLGANQEWDPQRKHRWKRNYSGGGMTTNSRGFMGPEFELKKKPGCTRIVCLGDSTAVIPPEHSYPTVLQERLRSLLPDKEIDVINAGCAGYDSGQSRIWYENEIDQIEHDVLVIYLGWNDMGKYNPDGLIDKLSHAGYAEHPTFIQSCFLNIYLLRGLYFVREYGLSQGSVSLDPMSAEDEARYRTFHPEHYEKNLKAIIELARKRGRTVWLCNFAGLLREHPTADELNRIHFPTGMGKSLQKYLVLEANYNRSLEEVSSATKAPIIDLASRFGRPEDRAVFTDTLHFNEQGADMVAGVIVDAISKDMARR